MALTPKTATPGGKSPPPGAAQEDTRGPGGADGGGSPSGEFYCGFCIRAVDDFGRCPSCEWTCTDLLTEPEARLFRAAWAEEENDDDRAGAAWLAVDTYRAKGDTRR